jgi:16S rRNA (cytidine1402-2'-O)-methyltransferase
MMNFQSPTAASYGTLYLIPNTLDFGLLPAEQNESIPVSDVIPMGSLQVAARLKYWVVENAKTARAFLKRIHQITPLHHSIQTLKIDELPRPPKGRATETAIVATAALNPQGTEIETLLTPLLQGEDLGVMSEAGLPAVADPGSLLVAAAHRQGIRVYPLSGPSSLLLALAASGLNGQSFAFVGYVPIHAHERTQRLKFLEQQSRREQQTQILIETPYRNQALFDALLLQLQPQTQLSVSIALTLPQTSTRMATVADWRRQKTQMPDKLPAVFCFLGAQ